MLAIQSMRDGGGLWWVVDGSLRIAHTRGAQGGGPEGDGGLWMSLFCHGQDVSWRLTSQGFQGQIQMSGVVQDKSRQRE